MNNIIKLSTTYLENLAEELAEGMGVEDIKDKLKKLNEAIAIAPFDREVLPYALDLALELENRLKNK